MKLEPAASNGRRAALTPSATLDVLDCLHGHGEFVMCAHENPDCDVLASGFALGLALKRLDKRVTYFLDGDVPANLRFLPEAELTQRTFDGVSNDAVFVFFDMSDQKRAGEALAWVPKERIANVDHHLSNTYFGRWNYVRDSEAATGVLVLHLILGLGVEVTPDIATCLLSAVLSDTGCFMYSNATPDTMRVAAGLVEAGADKDLITQKLYMTRPFGAQRLLGEALEHAKLTDDGICYTAVTRSMLAKHGVTHDDLEDLVGALRAIDKCEVAALFKESEDGDFRVSMRSRGRFNVMTIAKGLGGGGHFRAAGAPVAGPKDAAIARVLGAIRAEMAATPV